MKITTEQVRNARGHLGLSQATVCAETGISRNIMSAFEQQKIQLLDEMEDRLLEFYKEQGIDLVESGDVSTQREPSTDAINPAIPNASTNSHPDFRILDGYCVPRGITDAEAEHLLVRLSETEADIDDISTEAVEEGGLFGGSIATPSEERHQDLLTLHAKWACLVMELHGRGEISDFCDVVADDVIPENQRQLLAQRMAERFNDVEERVVA